MEAIALHFLHFAWIFLNIPCISQPKQYILIWLHLLQFLCRLWDYLMDSKLWLFEMKKMLHQIFMFSRVYILYKNKFSNFYHHKTDFFYINPKLHHNFQELFLLLLTLQKLNQLNYQLEQPQAISILKMNIYFCCEEFFLSGLGNGRLLLVLLQLHQVRKWLRGSSIFCTHLMLDQNAFDIINLLMSQRNFSYFNRHQRAIKTKQPTKTKPVPEREPEREQKSEQKYNEPISVIDEGEMNLSFAEKTQEEVMYEEYKSIQRKYQAELKGIEQQIDDLKRKTQVETRKIKQTQVAIQVKKKQLREVRKTYEEMEKVAQRQERLQDNNRVKKLQQALDSLKRNNNDKIMELTTEYQQIVTENTSLENKLNELKAQYEKAALFNAEDYEIQKQRLLDEQDRLKQQLQEMEKEEERLNRDIERIQTMKPVSPQVHRKYLDLYEKIFISKEIAKAQQILLLKQEEKKQKNECERRKQWLKEKQSQIKIREKRIKSKNDMIDSLTNQIKNKSVTLLTMYQTEQQKFKS